MQEFPTLKSLIDLPQIKDYNFLVLELEHTEIKAKKMYGSYPEMKIGFYTIVPEGHAVPSSIPAGKKGCLMSDNDSLIYTSPSRTTIQEGLIIQLSTKQIQWEQFNLTIRLYGIA